MSSKKFAAPLVLELHRSSRCFRLLSGLYGGAAFSIFMLAAPWWIRIPLLAGLAWSAWKEITLHACMRSPKSIRRLIWKNDDSWILSRTDQEIMEGRLLASSFVHPGLAVLNFSIDGPRMRRCTVILMSDSADRAALRRLRVRLRIQPPFGKTQLNPG